MPLSVDVNMGNLDIRLQSTGYWLLATDYRLLAQATMLKPGNEET
jgi:hypothetical protein